MGTKFLQNIWPSAQATSDLGTSSYVWYYSEFNGSCSEKCGMEEMAYTRVVECRRSDGVVVSHSECNDKPKSNVLYCPKTTPCPAVGSCNINVKFSNHKTMSVSNMEICAARGGHTIKIENDQFITLTAYQVHQLMKGQEIEELIKTDDPTSLDLEASILCASCHAGCDVSTLADQLVEMKEKLATAEKDRDCAARERDDAIRERHDLQKLLDTNQETLETTLKLVESCQEVMG